MKKLACAILLYFFGYVAYGSNHPIVPKQELFDISALTEVLDNIEKTTTDVADGKQTSLEKARKYQFPSVDAYLSSSLLRNGENDNMEDIDAMRQAYVGNPKVNAARKAIDGLASSNLISALTGAELFKFPVGIKDTAGGYAYSIVFDEVEIFPEYAVVRVYGGIQKEGGPQLMFGSDDIKISYEGGIIGESTLALFADFPYQPNSKNYAFVFRGFERAADGNHKGCYITFDCNGFESARIDGDIIISRNWVLPTDEEGRVLPGNQRVQANLAITVTDFDDFVTDVTLPYFTLTSDTSVAFILEKAVVDFSDQKNASDFVLPPIYDEETNLIVTPPPNPATDNLWKGVFIGRIEVILPEVFKQSDEALTFGAERLYIDNKGITGKFYADNLLTLDRGKLGETGWAFSLERVEMSSLYSQIYEFGFGGRVTVPVGEEGQGLRYNALANLKTETYNFELGVDSTMTIPMWKVSSVVFNKNTSLNVDVVQNKFHVQAVLCGSMNIEVKPTEATKNTDLKIADIKFHQLIIADKAPYVSLGEQAGHITFTAGPLLNNSILNVDHASISNVEENKVMFGIGMSAGPMSEDDGGAQTSGKFGMVAVPSMQNGRQKWEFEKMKLMALEIHLDFADAGYIKGGIEFFADDPVYGNGFSGYLEGGFVKDGSRYQFSAAASARFGTMNEGKEDEFKYWSFDVYVSSSSMAIPIYPPIAANGFGGGMYHHMSMAGYDLDLMQENGLTNPYSGIVYEPDSLTRLGLKATIGLTTTSGKAFQGVVTLELSFNQNLGLREIKLYGTGEISGSDTEGWNSQQKDGMASNTLTEAAAAANNEQKAKAKPNTISCAVMMRISLIDGFEMHGAFNVYLDAAEGKVTGKGTLDLYASTVTNKWHLYIGGYQDNSITNTEGKLVPPVSVGINFEAFKVTASLYLMTGNDLPGPPPLPAKIKAQFPNAVSNRSKLNEGGRSANDGTGIAFGSSLDIGFTHYKKKKNGTYNTNKYVNITATAGFDLALLSFSDYSRCSLAANNPHGQKGWRAYGNLYLYAHIEGKWFLKISPQYIGIIATGDLPNPTYLNLQVKIKIGNIINTDRSAEFGTKCGNVLN